MSIHFSIVIPLYNKEKYIRHTIESVLRQSHALFELIVVDDGSTDNSAELVLGFDDRRVRLIAQPNAGESAARNAGILAARHEYIAFLDGDDRWDPGHLGKLAQLIADFPQAGLYCMKYRFIEQDGETVHANWAMVEKRGYVERYFRSVARGDQIATASSACIPKSVFVQVGLFSVGDRLGADQDMWARIAVEHPVAADPDPTAIYLRSSDQTRICNSGNYDQELPYSRRLQARLDSNQVMGEQSSDIKEYIQTGLFTLVSVNLRKDDTAAARTILKDPRIHNRNPRFAMWSVLIALPAAGRQLIFRTVAAARKRPQPRPSLKAGFQ